MDPITILSNLFPNPTTIFFGIAILFLILLILRELCCWYWKINKIVGLLQDIRENTEPRDKKESIASIAPLVQIDSKAQAEKYSFWNRPIHLFKKDKKPSDLNSAI